MELLKSIFVLLLLNSNGDLIEESSVKENLVRD